MIGYCTYHEGDDSTMTEYKARKWGYVEELEDLMNSMVKEGWVFESITQPQSTSGGWGTVLFSRLTYPDPKRIDEGDYNNE